MKTLLGRTMFIQLAALGTTDEITAILGVAPASGQVSDVEFIPARVITGQDDNTRRVAITNRGSGGLGTGEAAIIQFDDGVDAAAFIPKTIPLNAIAADRDVTKGDVLTIDATAVGSGLALPAGTFIVRINRNDA